MRWIIGNLLDAQHYFCGRFCQVFTPSGWRTDVFEDFGEHVVAIVREIMGEPEEVWSVRHCPLAGELYFRTYSWSAVARMSWLSPKGKAPEMIIEGTKGTLHLNNSTIDCYGERTIPGIDRLWRFPKLQQRLTTWHKTVKCGGAHSYTRKLEEFLVAVKTRKRLTSFEDDLENLRILQAAINPETVNGASAPNFAEPGRLSA